MRLPQTFIDDLRLQANIVQVVQEYVPLKRAGVTYKGLCPFHSEKTPSFHVNPEKGFFHCFGCGAGGDVFKFLELHEKIGFMDAVRMLAQKFGMTVPEADGEEEPNADARTREALLRVHELAASFFREQLGSAAGARARQQLADRGVTHSTIEQLGLGLAPSSRDALRTHLAGQGLAQGLLLQSGLIVQRESGEIVDRFRNRLVVPICRDTGSVVAFGARAMEADQVPKYLNSPETAIYSKGRTLYGLNLTKAAIRKLGYAILVEGYFDFAQVFQALGAPAVASCGTALTSAQARLLRRFTTKVVLSYDPDAAGEGAVARSCDLLVAEGFDINVVALDPGQDPDTFVRQKGAAEYRERLRASRPYLEYLLEQASSGVDLNHADARRQFLSRMLAVAAKIPDAAERDRFADRIAHRARITEEVVRAEIRKAAVHRQTSVAVSEPAGEGPLKAAERGLIWGVFHQTAQALDALRGLEPDDFRHLAGREIFEVARGLQDRPPELIPSELVRRLSKMDAQLVTGIAGQEAPFVTDRGLAECARTLRRLRWERERAAIQREIDRLQGLGQEEHNDKIMLLLSEKGHLAQRIEELT